MGELLELVAVGGDVASFVGEFHTSQCIALQSCRERVWGKPESISSGSGEAAWQRCGWDLCGLGHIGSRCSMVGSG